MYEIYGGGTQGSCRCPQACAPFIFLKSDIGVVLGNCDGCTEGIADPSLLLFARRMCVPKVRLLVLLAALVPGRVDAGLECYDGGFLRDPSKCRAADIMRAFGGRGLACDGNNVRRKGGCCRAERPAHLQGRAAGAVPPRIQREGCLGTARLALCL